jgi:hypothetical protein
LLILLENYVLACIGALPPQQHNDLLNVVQQTFGGGIDWMQTLRERLDLDAGIGEHVSGQCGT